MSNIPKLRFPEFKGEWEEKIIQDFAECCAGATPDTKKDEYWIDGTIPWMSSGEVNNTFIYSTEKKITQLGYDKTSTKLLPSNTVVIALAGQGKTRGTVAITRIELCTNQSLCAVLPDINLNSEYLFIECSPYLFTKNHGTGVDNNMFAKPAYSSCVLASNIRLLSSSLFILISLTINLCIRHL